ncbi:MAG: TonB family protein [Candidatus Omnitrophica bacterium]|nr:TonB family protein [Candidatus Omnitrophota bacterium]
MRKKTIITLGIIGCLLGGVLGHSQDFIEEITLISGETVSVPVYSPKKVGVADPNIADIVTTSDREVVLIGKMKGRTSFFVNDSTGDYTYKVQVIPEDMDHLLKRVRSILKDMSLKDVKVKPVADQGKVLLIGSVRTVEDKELLEVGLGELFPKVTDLVKIEEAALVEILVEVLEMSTGATKELGFVPPRTVTFAEAAVPPAGISATSLVRIAPLQRSDVYSWKWDMLESEGKVKVLSRPRVICQSGKEAEILVGGEVPIFTTSVASAGGEGTTVEYKEYGIKLKINPTVTATERVELGLKIEISELGEAEYIGTALDPTARAYPIKKRDISTSLHLTDGSTLAIGGLIRQKTSEDLIKFPWLSEVPVLGAFFRHKKSESGEGSTAKGDTELYITITPKVVYTADPKSLEEKRVIAQEEKFIDKYKKSDIPEELQNYILEIQRMILANISYPSVLVGTGWEGNIALRLTIVETGELKEVQVLKASGYKIFDEQALKLVNSLKYAPFPFDKPLEELKIDVPIVYREGN